MAFLAGPAVPFQTALVQLTRSQRAEPFGVWEGMGRGSLSLSPADAAIIEIVKLLNRLMGIIELKLTGPRQPPEDDFMRGWGEPGGSIEDL